MIFRSLLLLLASACSVFAVHDWDGSQILPVHRIALRDESGAKILPQSEDAMPISTRMTCGPCHNIDTIGKGWHFSPEGDLAGRPAEPWVWVSEKSGTQIPISLREADGAWALEQLGMSDWDFVREFGRHLPGGGIADRERTSVDPDSRWKVSGNLEANCFACHNTAHHQDMTEWVKQIARENFRWAATAAACLGEVPGMASRLPSTWIPSDGVDPDDQVYRVPPTVHYDTSQFNSKNNVVLDLGKPTDARCLQCHTVAEVGKEKHHVTGDVHTMSGMSCVSCHRNDISHNIDRGIAGRYSCAGCHMGESHGDDHDAGEHGSDDAIVGTYGAPVPEHKGLPPIHLEKMACTTCHSGVAIDHGPALVRTSRINRLGIHGRAQWMTEAPEIIEPVFLKDADGKLAPHRMMWPAFWARQQGDDLVPINPDTALELGGDILNPGLAVARILSRLNSVRGADPKAQAAFLTHGTLYVANADGGVDTTDFEGPLLPAFQAFGYIVDGTLEPIAELYDAAEENAFYYLDESRQEHVINVLAALAELAPEGAYPAWILGKKRHRLEQATYELVPQDVVDALRKTASEAKVQVDALAAKLDVAAEVDGTKQKFYNKADKKELRASKSKTPELYELKLLMKAQGKAEAELSQFEFLGDKVYRNTFQKNTSRYPVIEDDESGDANESRWGWVKDGVLQPLISDDIGALVHATIGGDTVQLSEKQVSMALGSMGTGIVYVAQGKMFSLGAGGVLTATDHTRAEPVSWPIGHDVRPAAQSLGAKSCKECHSAEAPFFFSSVTPTGPLVSDKVSAAAMVDYMEMSEDFNKLFGLMFLGRSWFKAAMLGLAGIALLVLLAHLFSGVRAWTLRIERPALRRTAAIFGWLSTIVLIITGFPALKSGPLGGYPLLLHTVAGTLFALCLAALTVLMARDVAESAASAIKKLCFWVLVLSGIVLVLSILIAMVPLLGTHGQHCALKIHTLAAIVFTAAGTVYPLVARKRM